MYIYIYIYTQHFKRFKLINNHLYSTIHKYNLCTFTVFKYMWEIQFGLNEKLLTTLDHLVTISVGSKQITSDILVHKNV